MGDELPAGKALPSNTTAHPLVDTDIASATAASNQFLRTVFPRTRIDRSWGWTRGDGKGFQAGVEPAE
ncbi:hypothetical protein CH294_11845 [Rhodococcus sp. 14-2483-1-1]|nr:hypothetical protein CH294_11845 [Rhodococcus sp. 14-2483-1-1]